MSRNVIPKTGKKYGFRESRGNIQLGNSQYGPSSKRVRILENGVLAGVFLPEDLVPATKPGPPQGLPPMRVYQLR